MGLFLLLTANPTEQEVGKGNKGIAPADLCAGGGVNLIVRFDPRYGARPTTTSATTTAARRFTKLRM